MTSAYPLTSPDHIERSRTRESGRFRTTQAAALKNVRTSLTQFGRDSGKKVDHVVISTNYTLSEHRPADPGVAVSFQWDSMQVCIPVDRYNTIEANLQAIHHVVEARRVEIRHGTLALLRASFRGLLALPPPDNYRTWRDILGLAPDANPNVDSLKTAYRRAAKKVHSEGSSEKIMTAINVAHDEGMNESGL
ncbi:J domain-containing protein [Phyllobacterium sp. P5_D12]